MVRPSREIVGSWVSIGTAIVRGTGHPLIDDRVLPAQFTRKRFSATAGDDNLPSKCIDQSSLMVSVDFEGFSSNQLELNEVHTQNCAGAPDDYCKGYWSLSLTQMQ